MRAVITYLRRLIGATNVVIPSKATRNAKGLPTASRLASRAGSGRRPRLLGALTHLHLGRASAGPFYFGPDRLCRGGVTPEMYKEFHHQAPVTERSVAL